MVRAESAHLWDDILLALPARWAEANRAKSRRDDSVTGVAQHPPHAPSTALTSDRPLARRGHLALCLLIAGYALGYAWLSWLRFHTFHAQIDLSYYLRLIWGVAHGHFDLPLVQAKHVLGLHAEPIVLPLALLARLGVPLPALLLTLQALAVALLAWPAYRLGVRHIGPALAPRWPVECAGLGAALVALLYPTVTVATLHDVHPVTLALAPLLGVVDALADRALRRAIGLGLLALTCREDIALQLACLFVASALLPSHHSVWPRRARWILLAAAGLLVAYCFAYLLWLQPGHVPKQGSYQLHFDRVAQALGTPIASSRDLVWAAMRHPLRVAIFFADRERLLYPVLLLWPVAGLALLAPLPLAGALPIVAVNFLSGFPNVLRLESHYTTAIVPFVLGAAIVGAGRLLVLLQRVMPRARARALLVIALLPSVLSAHIWHGGSPLALRSARFRGSLFRDGEHAQRLRAQIAAVPPQASVAARPGPLAHLAERPRAISPPEYTDGQPVDVEILGE